MSEQVTAAAPPLLEMRGIHKRFGEVQANRGVDLSVRRGEIHGLLGENGAGKSTLMNILYGLVQPDAGEIRLEGDVVRITSPRRASELGIGMVHQHFMLVPNLTVAENILLACDVDGPLWRGLSSVAPDIRRLCARYGLSIDPLARVDELSLGQQQRIEILKLLHAEASLMIFDEPTAVLTPPEWEELGLMMRRYADEEKSIIFITHKLGELYEVADRCTVMRAGEVIATVDPAKTERRDLATMMVGRDIQLRADRVESDLGPPIVDVEDLGLVDAHGVTRLAGISFTLHAGEIFGIAGVDGNGQRELLEVLVGVRSATSGRVRIGEVELKAHGPTDFFRAGGAAIPDDRRTAGLATSLTVHENLVARAITGPVRAPFGMINHKRARTLSSKLVAEFDIRVPSVDVRVAQLSGGNQQRTVLARELHTDPRFIVAAQPTRGLDIGAIEAVYAILRRHQARGGATLLISTELDELLTLCDRIAVLSRGTFTGVVNPESVSIERLGMLISAESSGAGTGHAT